jgi:GcrA cell cycle regulator
MRWTTEATETLRRLWAEGRSASVIAAELGNGITRNSVIGKVHRIHLERRRTRHAAYQPRDKGAKREQIARARPSLPQVPSQVVLAPLPFSLPLFVTHQAQAPQASPGTVGAVLRLKRGDCRYPFGDPGDADFRFCCAPAEIGPYCQEHAAVCYDFGGAEAATRRAIQRKQWKAA